MLIDAGIAMFDKMLGRVFRKADRRHQEHLVSRAQMLDTTTRALLGMARAMLAAKTIGADPAAAAMLAWLAVGVWAVPARAAVDIHIGIPGVVVVPPSYYYDYPRYIYPYSEPRYDKRHRRHRHHRHGHHYYGHHHGHGR